MTFDTFKKLYKKFENIDYSKLGWRTEEYDDFLDAKFDNYQFHEWYLEQELIKENFNYQKYCCPVLAYHVFNGNRNQNESIIKIKSDGSYTIPIHDGGPSLVAINNCPWCGSNLKKENE